jgi:hypothetical protein
VTRDRAVREVDGGAGNVAHLGNVPGRHGTTLLVLAVAGRRTDRLDELALDTVEDVVRADDVEQVEDVRREHREAERHQGHRQQRREGGDVRLLQDQPEPEVEDDRHDEQADQDVVDLVLDEDPDHAERVALGRELHRQEHQGDQDGHRRGQGRRVGVQHELDGAEGADREVLVDLAENRADRAEDRDDDHQQDEWQRPRQQSAHLKLPGERGKEFGDGRRCRAILLESR